MDLFEEFESLFDEPEVSSDGAPPGEENPEAPEDLPQEGETDAGESGKEDAPAAEASPEKKESSEFLKKAARKSEAKARGKAEDEEAFDPDKEISDLGFTARDIRPAVERIVKDIPELKAAAALVAEANKKAENAAFEAEMKKITDLDPEVKSPADFDKLQNREIFEDLVFNRGYALSDAFKIASFERLMKITNRKARQETLNSVHSKDHLSKTEGGAGDEISVPEDIMEEYLALNPDATRKEITEHYRKSLKARKEN